MFYQAYNFGDLIATFGFNSMSATGISSDLRLRPAKTAYQAIYLDKLLKKNVALVLAKPLGIGDTRDFMRGR